MRKWRYPRKSTHRKAHSPKTMWTRASL